MKELIRLFNESKRNGIAIIVEDKAYVYSNFNEDNFCHLDVLSLQSNFSLRGNKNHMLSDKKIKELKKILLDKK